MIYARNQIVVPVGAAGVYTPAATFTLNEGQEGVKLTARVYDNAIYLEVSEAFPAIFTGDIDAEMLLDKGFQSLSFITPIYGFRFRAEVGAARVDFRCYG